MTTARNYFDGILGTILVIFGIMFLFVAPIFGLLMIIVGGFLHYKSKTYVHQ